MTDKEKAIVMAYTGIAMLIGDKFEIFHKYVEEIMFRPVFTHEFATYAEEIKEKAKPDFLKLCAEEEPDRPHEECRTCKHFVRGGLDGKTYVCEHPYILLDDQFDYACITMNENDFCSRYFPREGDEK